jgi:hypothetical protein
MGKPGYCIATERRALYRSRAAVRCCVCYKVGIRRGPRLGTALDVCEQSHAKAFPEVTLV